MSMTFLYIFLLALLSDVCGEQEQRRTLISEHAREHLQMRLFDGFFNNPSHPEWGSIGQPISNSEYGSAFYSDGAKMVAKGPNARKVSTKLLRGPSGHPSAIFSALFAFFGQLISREIMDIDEPTCPREIYGIDVSDDEVFTKDIPAEDMIYMPVYRSKYDKTTGIYSGNPRKQINGATSWMDASFIYGPSSTWTDALRKFEGGLFDLDVRGLPRLNERGLPYDNFPPPRTHKLASPKSFWAVGDRKGHENPALLSFSILFMRYHNAIAQEISQKEALNSRSNLTDRQIFVKARSKTTAVLQSIIMYEWLPLLLNKTADDLAYTAYQPSLTPQVDSLYAAVGSKWIMTLIPPAIPLRSSNGCGKKPKQETLRLCETWFDGQKLISESDTDLPRDILLGLAAQPAEKEDHIIVEDLLDYHYGPLHFSRTDAAAEFIIRGRDFGIQPGQLHLDKTHMHNNWKELLAYLDVSDKTADKIKELYSGEKGDKFENIDLFVFALFEKDNSTGSAPGYIIKKVIERQLTRLRDADFFWFENRVNRLFTDDELAEIKATKIGDVMAKAFSEEVDVRDGFYIANATCRFPALNSSELRPCTGLKTFDYFAGNEFAFIISWIWIGIFPFAVIGLAYGAHILAESRRKKVKRFQTPLSSSNLSALIALGNLGQHDRDTGNMVYATEWMGTDEEKLVKIVLSDTTYVLYIQTIEGQPIRSVNLAVYEVLTVHICPRSPFTALVQLPKSYDLVLRFPSHDQVQSFCAKLNSYVYENGKLMVRQPASWKSISKKAVTKSRRKENLNSFFRNVFAQAFNSNDMRSNTTSANRDIVEFEISKEEFADSLGMKANSKFVELMFNVADKQKRGFLRFREILELVIIMSKGSPDRKLELLFDMFDFTGSGKIARDEITQVVRSLVDLAGSSNDNSDLKPIVTEMYACAGLSDKDALDFNDFKRLLTCKDEHFMSKVGVDWKGVKKTIPKKAGLRLLGNGNKHLTLDSLPDDSINSVLRSKESIKRASAFYDSSKAFSSHGGTMSTSITDDVESLCSEDSSFSHTRIGFYDTPEGTLDRKRVQKPSSLRLRKLELPSLDPRTAKLKAFIHYIENRKREIAVLFFYYAVCIGLFLERFYFYIHSNEHNGARATLGAAVAFARGSAEVISFSFSIMLITMSYNMVRFMRETVLNLYIPFDKNIVFHKIVAWTGLAFAAVHVVAYGFNYYFLASGPASHACFFETQHYSSNQFIGIGATLYTSLPGITGVLLVLTLMVMYIFASQTARRYMHNTFWIAHKLFIVLYALMIMHGLLWLTQKPNFYAHFLGPCILFIFDKVLSVTRRKMKLNIIKADLLPSNVTRVMFKRPANFEYKSGMWVRIACDALGLHEYHPFTLTSSPHEDFLSLHIRGVGPWTLNLRSVIESSLKRERALPNIYVDGPFGSGQQDWYNFEVSVLVGAGIGVTPYSSILKDFVHMMRTRNRFKIKCQKVYFIWSTSNQRSFEWLIDILKQVEEVDIHNTVSTNIFITQFFQSFDLRTSMLYVFEEHAKKLGGCSLFTGLKATTNFGRPNFIEIFAKISDEHLKVKNIGVFSCGPPAMTKGVEQACIKSSATTHSQFQHHYENF